MADEPDAPEEPEEPDDEDYVTVCPQCLSPRVSYETGHFPGQKYRCKDCGNVTSFIIEAPPEELEDLARDRAEDAAREGGVEPEGGDGGEAGDGG